MYIGKWDLYVSDPHILDIKEGRMGWRKLLREYPTMSEHQAKILPDHVRNDTLDRIDAVFDVGDGETPAVDMHYNKEDGSATITILSPKLISTQAELFEHANIDPYAWDIVNFTAKAWPAHQKGPDNNPVVIQMSAVSAKLKPRVETVALKGLVEDLMEDLKASVDWTSSGKRAKPTGENLVVLQFPDVHFGKEDANDQLRVFMDAVEDLVSKGEAFGVARWVIVAGNDATHIDNVKGTTTSGTQLEYVGTWQQNFRTTVTAYRQMVERCLRSAPVDIIVVPGNHDENTSFAVGEVLSALYEQHPDVSVSNDEDLRKYYTFGVNLLGFTHGKYEKLNDLPMIMAQEMSLQWSQTIYREWFTADKHHQQVKEYQGVIVRISPSLSNSDGWHKKMGYVSSMRGAEAHVYSKLRGKVGMFTHIPS